MLTVLFSALLKRRFLRVLLYYYSRKCLINPCSNCVQQVNRSKASRWFIFVDPPRFVWHQSAPLCVEHRSEGERSRRRHQQEEQQQQQWITIVRVFLVGSFWVREKTNKRANTKNERHDFPFFRSSPFGSSSISNFPSSTLRPVLFAALLNYSNAGFVCCDSNFISIGSCYARKGPFAGRLSSFNPPVKVAP